MSALKSSPFYNPIHDTKLSRPIWPMVCRCKVQDRKGAVLDTTRNMWVCSNCRKPYITNQNYIKVCEWCRNLFVLWYYDSKRDDISCRKCGGKNVAELNMVTEDPVERYAKDLHGELA